MAPKGADERFIVGRFLWHKCLLAALAPVTAVSGIDVMAAPIFGRWEPEGMFHWRDSIFAMWALVPCFGLTAACCYWLFQRDGSRGHDREHAVEKPG
jgi:hypothetical protein